MGRTSWAAVGTIVLLVILSMALGAINGILVPFVIGIIIGVIMEPLVLRLERWGLKRLLATVTVMVVAIALATGMIAVVVRGLLT